METQNVPGRQHKALRNVSMGTVGLGLVGAAAVALGIIGLAQVYPIILVSAATIAIGASFVLEGSAIASRFSSLAQEVSPEGADVSEFGMGMTTEFLGGISGVALGILGLIGIVPMVLIPAAIIVYGGTLVFSSGMSTRLNTLEVGFRSQNEFAREIAQETGSAAASIYVLVGLAAITLGILAIIGIASVILSLVSVLAIGLLEFVHGTTISVRLWGIIRE